MSTAAVRVHRAREPPRQVCVPKKEFFFCMKTAAERDQWIATLRAVRQILDRRALQSGAGGGGVGGPAASASDSD